jgi:hypothetical protein
MSLVGDYKKKYDEWLGINREQWGQLTQFGVCDGTELELDFTFSSSTESSAKNLESSLKANCDYESTVEFLPEDGPESPATWVVYGTTPPTASSLESLDTWVEKLIQLGADNECMFESWGTYPPQSERSLFLGANSGIKSDEYPFNITVRIPGHIEPMDRGERYEDPLNVKLQEAQLGEVVGGGSQLDEQFAIQSIDLEVCVADIDVALTMISKVLEECGAPKGSKLIFERDNDSQTLEFGVTEGIALCLDAKLPEELWDTHAQEVWPQIEQVLKSTSAGQIYGCKSFEEATEIYIYGLSGDAIIASLEEFRNTYPLCQNSAVRKLSVASQ